MYDLEELAAKLLGDITNDEAKLIIEEIALAKEGESMLIQLLDLIRNIRIQNIIALSLGDMGSTSAVPSLIKHISNPANKDTNGTLLYALERLDAKEAVVTLAQTACKGDYETIAMVINAVENFSAPLCQQLQEESLNILNLCLQEQLPEWKYKLLIELYELIDSFDAV